MIILTSIPPAQLSALTLGAIYRLRWQIELFFKRLKSLLGADQLRARRGSLLAQAYLLGKMLYACRVERRAQRCHGAAHITWRLWQLIERQLQPLITGVAHWGGQLKRRALQLLRERPRRRKRQALPKASQPFFQQTPLSPNECNVL